MDGCVVSMEPQIGIRGRAEEGDIMECCGMFQWSPRLVSGEGLVLADPYLFKQIRFNGAPDRNPGKDQETVHRPLAGRDVSMEPQIGIRGRGSGAKSLPRRGLRGGERSCIKSPHSIARNWLRMSVLHPFLSMLCKPKRRRSPRPGFQRAD